MTIRNIIRMFIVLGSVGLAGTAGSAQTANAVAPAGAPVATQPRTFKETFPTPLLQAIALKDDNAVRTLLSRKTTIVYAPDGDDYTKVPILLASVGGDLAIIKVLLDAGANIESCGQYRMTPLMMASLRGNLAVVQLLLERGARVNAQSDLGASALMTASRDGFVEVVRALLGNGADVNAVTTTRFTALMAAADNTELVGLLLKAGAKPDPTDANGNSAACLAVKNGQAWKLAMLRQFDPSAGRTCSPSR